MRGGCRRVPGMGTIDPDTDPESPPDSPIWAARRMGHG